MHGNIIFLLSHLNIHYLITSLHAEEFGNVKITLKAIIQWLSVHWNSYTNNKIIIKILISIFWEVKKWGIKIWEFVSFLNVNDYNWRQEITGIKNESSIGFVGSMVQIRAIRNNLTLLQVGEAQEVGEDRAWCWPSR